jgi:hypothetical protein
MNPMVEEAMSKLPDDIVPVGFAFAFKDGELALLPFCKDYEAVATILESCAKTLRAKGVVQDQLRKHH